MHEYFSEQLFQVSPDSYSQCLRSRPLKNVLCPTTQMVFLLPVLKDLAVMFKAETAPLAFAHGPVNTRRWKKPSCYKLYADPRCT